MLAQKFSVPGSDIKRYMGSVEKVGVEPDPKRAGPASWNLEHA